MYKRFSDFYDRLVFDIDYEKYADNIRKILKNNSIDKAEILEIGCGTGNLTQELAKNPNFNILAFDYSAEMLNHAYEKLIDLDNVNIIMHDMHKFPYQSYQFDAVISLLDVINYIIDENKLSALFENIYKSLVEGGVFVFDLNSEYKLFTQLGDNHYVYEMGDIFYTWENSRERDLVYFDLNFFIENKNGTYKRFVEKQVERYYSIEFIKETLEKIGFKDVDIKDEDGGEYDKSSTKRILFSARK